MHGDKPNREISSTARWRLALLAFLVVGGFLAVRATPLSELFSDGALESVIGLARETWWAPWLLIGLYVVLAPLGVPIGPLFIYGAFFGAFLGTIYGIIGHLLGAAVSYQLARTIGREAVIHLAGRRLRRVERVFERRGFWPLVQTRLLPIPFAVVNFGAALAGVKPMRFLATSVLGMVPSITLHTYFLSRLLETPPGGRLPLMLPYMASFGLLNLALSLPWLRSRMQRRERYRKLVACRATRLV